MKICYDNLDGIKLTSNGIFLKNNSDSYIEMESCKRCGEPYLTLKHRPSVFCSKSCAFTNRKYSDLAIKNMSKAKKGKKSSFYKHGGWLKGLPVYSVFYNKLWADKVGYRYVDDIKVLTVKCAHCGSMFVPSYNSVISRVRYLEGKVTCEGRFYCSDKCRAECPIFGQHTYQKNHKSEFAYSSSEYKVWRSEVLRRAEYKCEYCEMPATEVHHIRPKKLEPFFALDPDYGLAVCKECHFKYGHRDDCNTAMIANKLCINS